MPSLLKITAKLAKLTHDTDSVGKMDPYCVLTLNNQTKKTNVHKNGHLNPKWEEKFEFQAEINDILHYKVFEVDAGAKDDLVGEGSFTVTSLYLNNLMEDWMVLKYENGKKDAGQLLLEIELIPELVKQKTHEELVLEEVAGYQAQIAELMKVVEEERVRRDDKNSAPAAKIDEDPQLRKKANALHKDLENITQSIANFDVEMADLISKFKNYQSELNKCKSDLDQANDEFSFVRQATIPGRLRIDLLSSEIEEENEIRFLIYCGSQNQEVKVNKLQFGNIKAHIDFKIQEHNSFIIVALNKDGRLVGIGGSSIFHLQRGEVHAEETSVLLKGMAKDVGRVKVKMEFERS